MSRRCAATVRRWLLPALGAVALLAAPSTSHAYVRSRTSSGQLYRWTSTCIPIEVHLAALPGVTTEQIRTAVEGAARAWSAEANPCTSVRFALSFVDDSGPASANDGHNVIAAHSEGWCAATDAPGTETPAMCNAPSAMAATSVFVAAANGRIAGADTQLNTINFLWAALDETGQPADRWDLQSAVTHELGHVLGLEHPCWGGIGPHAVDDQGQTVPDCYGAAADLQQDTMFPATEPGTIGKRALSPDVQRAACEIYPAATVTGDAATPPTGPAGATCAAPRDDGGCAVAGTDARRPRGSGLVWPMMLALAVFFSLSRARPRK